MSTDQTTERFTPKLDDMLTRSEAAAWLQISERALSEKSSGRGAAIPAFRPSHKVVRYHPRTIIAKMAKDAGVPLEIIAVSLGDCLGKQ